MYMTAPETRGLSSVARCMSAIEMAVDRNVENTNVKAERNEAENRGRKMKHLCPSN